MDSGLIEKAYGARGGEKDLFSRKVFGRKAVKLSDNQKLLIEEFLPGVEIPLSVGKAALTGYLSKDGPLHLEIGFGDGEYSAALAGTLPDHLIIGCEIYRNGIASLLKRMKEGRLENIRIINGNAVAVMGNMLNGESLDFIHINHPDPWPKKRHHKRRLIQPETLEILAMVLKKGGEVWLSTDACDYHDWMLECFDGAPLFERMPAGGRLLDCLGAQKIATRYEQRGRAKGSPPKFLRYRKTTPDL